MGDHTEEVPKAFMRVAGQTLYDRQRAALDDYVDAITVVLGYAADNVVDEVTEARTVHFSEWADYENAESLRRGIAGVDDDVLVMNGDVVVTASAVGQLTGRFAETPSGRSVVGCLPGIQSEETAIHCDDRGRVIEYGLIRGYRHAGVGILDRTQLDRIREYLATHSGDWYPGLYTHVDTTVETIPPGHHIEINRPQDRLRARRKLPLEETESVDLGT